MVKEQTRIERIIDFISKFISIFLFLAIGSISIIINYFNDFFSKIYCFTGGQITIFLLSILFVTSVTSFILNRLKTKRLFKKGDRVQIKGHIINYFVEGYSFLQPDYVIVIDVSRGKNKKYKIIQEMLEIYDNSEY